VIWPDTVFGELTAGAPALAPLDSIDAVSATVSRTQPTRRGVVKDPPHVCVPGESSAARGAGSSGFLPICRHRRAGDATKHT